MWTRDFWLAVLERMLKSAAQGALTAAGITAGYFEWNWWAVVSGAAAGAVLSVLTSIASGAVTGGQASLNRAEVVPDSAKAAQVVYDEQPTVVEELIADQHHAARPTDTPVIVLAELAASQPAPRYAQPDNTTPRRALND